MATLPTSLLRPALLLTTLASTLLSAGGALAQVSMANVRAVNLARETAVNLNGGLSVYRPAACMFETSTGGGACLVADDDQGFLFRFPGGGPGWQQEAINPSLETEIRVAPDGRAVEAILYNGAPR